MALNNKQLGSVRNFVNSGFKENSSQAQAQENRITKKGNNPSFVNLGISRLRVKSPYKGNLKGVKPKKAKNISKNKNYLTLR